MNQNKTLFDTIPVGVEGLYVVRRTAKGEVSYLASESDPTKIAKHERHVARAEELRLVYGHPAAAEAAVWLPWPTHGLDTKKAAGVFTGGIAPRSSYDTLGRAA